MCMLSNDINDYNVVAQGKTTIPNVDDGEEFGLTDVSSPSKGWRQKNEVLVRLSSSRELRRMKPGSYRVLVVSPQTWLETYLVCFPNT